MVGRQDGSSIEFLKGALQHGDVIAKKRPMARDAVLGSSPVVKDAG